MKKSIKIILITILIPFLLYFLLYIFIVLINYLSSDKFVNQIIKNDKRKITELIKKEYPSYEIDIIKLQYINFFSTVEDIDDNMYSNELPELANVYIKKNENKIRIYLIKEHMKWSIRDAFPISGPIVPDSYFVVPKSIIITDKVDISKYIRDNKYWIIKNKDGQYFRKECKKNDCKVYIDYYEQIFKCENAIVYKFEKNNKVWEKTDFLYFDLKHYDNFKEIDKKKAVEILDKYASYKEE